MGVEVLDFDLAAAVAEFVGKEFGEAACPVATSCAPNGDAVRAVGGAAHWPPPPVGGRSASARSSAASSGADRMVRRIEVIPSRSMVLSRSHTA